MIRSLLFFVGERFILFETLGRCTSVNKVGVILLINESTIDFAISTSVLQFSSGFKTTFFDCFFDCDEYALIFDGSWEFIGLVFEYFS